jgi:transposase
MNEQKIDLAAIVGIDWADQEHAVCWRAADEVAVHHETLKQEPGALAAWAAGLQQRFGGRPVGVCLEQSRGPLIYALSAYPWLVLYPVNPKSLARYREALSPSRAKDDPSDAALLCQFLALHREQLRPWQADDPATRQLRLLLENRKKLVDQRTSLTHQLRALLKMYFPQALDWAGDLLRPMAWAFLLKWSSLEATQKASAKQLLNFYYAHGVRRGDLIAQVPDQVRAAVPLVRDPALIETSVLVVQALCRQLQALQPFIDRHNEQIKELFDRHPDRDLFRGVPGAGPVMAPRLLAAFGADRTRFSDAADVQQLSGIAPVTERSGTSCWVHWRWAASSFLRQSFHEHALHSLARSVWAKAYYQQQRERGKGHQAAVRALAFKWIRVLYACWRDRRPYDEAAYLAALRRRNSPLASLCTT